MHSKSLFTTSPLNSPPAVSMHSIDAFINNSVPDGINLSSNMVTNKTAETNCIQMDDDTILIVDEDPAAESNQSTNIQTLLSNQIPTASAQMGL